MLTSIVSAMATTRPAPDADEPVGHFSPAYILRTPFIELRSSSFRSMNSLTPSYKGEQHARRGSRPIPYFLSAGPIGIALLTMNSLVLAFSSASCWIFSLNTSTRISNSCGLAKPLSVAPAKAAYVLVAFSYTPST